MTLKDTRILDIILSMLRLAYKLYFITDV